MPGLAYHPLPLLSSHILPVALPVLTASSPFLSPPVVTHLAAHTASGQSHHTCRRSMNEACNISLAISFTVTWHSMSVAVLCWAAAP